MFIKKPEAFASGFFITAIYYLILKKDIYNLLGKQMFLLSF